MPLTTTEHLTPRLRLRGSFRGYRAQLGVEGEAAMRPGRERSSSWLYPRGAPEPAIDAAGNCSWSIPTPVGIEPEARFEACESRSAPRLSDLRGG